MFEEKIAALNEQYEEKMAVENKPFEKRTYTVDEIQDILSISKPSAYNLVKSGLFRYVRIGGSIRISKKVLMNGWISNFDFVKDVDDTIDKLQENKNLRYTLAKPTSLAKVFSGENMF